MNLKQPSNSQFDEPCITDNSYPAGFFNIEPPASLMQEHDIPAFRHPVSNNRLKAELKAFLRAHLGDPLAFIIESATCFIAMDQTQAKAYADLAVTGRANYAQFRVLRPQEETLMGMLKTHLGLIGEPRNDVATRRRNLRLALDRAYRVAWALQGYGDRASLGYICVCAEIDMPHRPVNVPGPSLSGNRLPQFDCTVTVQPTRNNPSPIEVNTRFIIVGNDQTLDGSIDVRAEVSARRMPPEIIPQFPSGKGIILGIHGHSSRAEEMLDVASHLVLNDYVVVAMDLPTNGYASMIDTARLGPLPRTDDEEAMAATGPFSVLEFIEQFIVDFVLTLDRSTSAAITQQIRGVIGGSLGGNMGLRLSQRSTIEFPWLYNVVAWSPASTWGPSWGRADAGGKFESVRVTRDRFNEEEIDETRYNHFYRAFGYYQLFEGDQSDRWYRDGWEPCKEKHVQGARFETEERYNELLRRWHWRVAHEQLVFMHFEANTPGGHSRYKNIQSRVLLGAGDQDNHFEKLWDNTREMATMMINTPGTTLWLNQTGHSIHTERPRALAHAITTFLSPQRPSAETEFYWTDWQTNDSPPLIGESLTTAVNEDGTVEVFGIAANSLTIFRSKQSGINRTNFEAWQEITANIPSGVPFAGKLAVAPLRDGRLRMYARRTDRNWMVHLTQTAANGDWIATDLGNDFRQLIGGIQAGAAVGVRVGRTPEPADDPVRLHLVAATLLNGITHIRGQESWPYPDDYWDQIGNDGDIGTNVRFNRTPVVARNHDGRLELINVDPTGKVWHIWEESTDHWIPNWDRLAGGVLFGSVAVGLNSDGRLEAFGVGGDGQLWHTQQAAINNGWSNWESLGGHISVGSTPAVVRNAWGRLQVFVRWNDNSIRYRRQSIDNYSTWEEWANLRGDSTSDPVVAQNTNGKLILMTLGTDHRLNFRHYYGPELAAIHLGH
jgi:pimeloyl-ACP methyl ester carboxylesterase